LGSIPLQLRIMNRLPELIQAAFGTFTLAVAVVLTVLGLLCLISGKKFYWLSVGICGFLISYVSIRGMINWNDWQEFALAGFIGIATMLLSFVFRKFVIAITAFLVFGLMLSAFINEQVRFDDDSFLPLLIFFMVGSLSAFFSFYRYDLCVRLLSCVVGALALTAGIFKFFAATPNTITIFLVWTGIAMAGFVWQQARREKPFEDAEVLLED